MLLYICFSLDAVFELINRFYLMNNCSYLGLSSSFLYLKVINPVYADDLVKHLPMPNVRLLYLALNREGGEEFDLIFIFRIKIKAN